MPRRTVQGLDASNKRDQIVDCAVALFGERGIESTTMRDVAAAVGITDATLYHYFSSKQALAEAAVHSVSLDVEDIESILEDHGDDLIAALLAVGEAFLSILAENTQWTRMVVRESLAAADSGVPAIAARTVAELGERRVAGLARRIQLACGDGVSARMAATQFFNSCLGFWIGEGLIQRHPPSARRRRDYLGYLASATVAGLELERDAQ